jgi:hypothetical protein
VGARARRCEFLAGTRIALRSGVMRTLVLLLAATCTGAPTPKQRQLDQIGPVLGQSTATGPSDPSVPPPDAPGVPPVDQPLPEKPGLPAPANPNDLMRLAPEQIPQGAGSPEMH